jgi:hypothetical protein
VGYICYLDIYRLIKHSKECTRGKFFIEFVIYQTTDCYIHIVVEHFL